MVYEKTMDEILDRDEDEDSDHFVSPESRKRSKLLSQRSSEIAGVPKPKLKRASSELSMSPITLSSDTDDDVRSLNVRCTTANN
jgi:hypothetical protein